PWPETWCRVRFRLLRHPTKHICPHALWLVKHALQHELRCRISRQRDLCSASLPHAEQRQAEPAKRYDALERAERFSDIDEEGGHRHAAAHLVGDPAVNGRDICRHPTAVDDASGIEL